MKKICKNFSLYFFILGFVILSCTVNEDILIQKDPPELKIEGEDPLVFNTDIDELAFEITNTGSMTLSWDITDDKSWLIADPNNGNYYNRNRRNLCNH